jgi:hypothetical protein
MVSSNTFNCNPGVYPLNNLRHELGVSVREVLKAGLHNGNYHSKVVHFEAKKIFYVYKRTSLERFSP